MPMTLLSCMALMCIDNAVCTCYVCCRPTSSSIIWAYKILFLDVLFSLDVPRMIFVDSDQVVRTDLAELYKMEPRGEREAASGVTLV